MICTKFGLDFGVNFDTYSKNSNMRTNFYIKSGPLGSFVAVLMFYSFIVGVPLKNVSYLNTILRSFDEKSPNFRNN